MLSYREIMGQMFTTFSFWYKNYNVICLSLLIIWFPDWVDMKICSAGPWRLGFHFHLGLWERRHVQGQLQLWWLCQQHIHIDREQHHREGSRAQLQWTLCSSADHNLQWGWWQAEEDCKNLCVLHFYMITYIIIWQRQYERSDWLRTRWWTASSASHNMNT